MAITSSLSGGGERPRLSVRPAATSISQAAGALPSAPPQNLDQLAADLTQAHQIVDDSSSSAAELRSAGRFQQLATVELVKRPARARREVLASLRGGAAASLRADLSAALALARLNTPRHSLPPWKIVAPPAPAILLSYFKAAQRRSGVPWQYLAAIELIETDFGRVAGLSTAGAEGPMQFMPATWAEYGRGNAHNPRDAIFAAARFLLANGAPRDMPAAIYHYNPSSNYVAAVRAYARRMAADPRAFSGYYYWQVIYARASKLLILPVGFPKARPLALAALAR
jgi:membrane-bound lytic murein transglycosylase B